MNIYKLLLFTAIISMTASNSVMAAEQVSGNSAYTKLWSGDEQRPSFYDLEQLGVRKAAEDAAVQNCYARGHAQCLPESSRITMCNISGGVSEGQAVIHCEGAAVAISIGD